MPDAPATGVAHSGVSAGVGCTVKGGNTGGRSMSTGDRSNGRIMPAIGSCGHDVCRHGADNVGDKSSDARCISISEASREGVCDELDRSGSTDGSSLVAPEGRMSKLELLAPAAQFDAEVALAKLAGSGPRLWEELLPVEPKLARPRPREEPEGAVEMPAEPGAQLPAELPAEQLLSSPSACEMPSGAGSSRLHEAR